MRHQVTLDTESSSEAFVGKKKGAFETCKLWKKEGIKTDKQIENVN